MRRNLLLLLLWLAGLLAVDAQTLSRKEVETYVINQYGKRWKDIALYLGEKDTLDKDNALTFEKTISVRGKSKNELFVDLNYWFLKTFSNASSSIEMADKELGVFMAKGYLPGIAYHSGGYSSYCVNIRPLVRCDEDGISVYYEHDKATGERNGKTTKSPAFEDRTITGCAQPKLNVGWNNSFSYKNWSASFFFTGVFGNKIYNGLRAHYTAPDFFAGGKNVLKEFITDRPATDTSSNIPSDKFIENGSYVRLQNLSLGYTFRNLDGWLNSLQLYVNANNVFTITSYKGLDPEVNLGGIDPGVDYRWSNYPHTRTIMVGAKINF